ncbi:uncharacterized protein [Panulirus ornatus]|uniref:uncharacterized protein n=1 Tax=Panulirus ornatus TaxID=150431 RepID=UPI003A880EDB
MDDRNIPTPPSSWDESDAELDSGEGASPLHDLWYQQMPNGTLASASTEPLRSWTTSPHTNPLASYWYSTVVPQPPPLRHRASPREMSPPHAMRRTPASPLHVLIMSTLSISRIPFLPTSSLLSIPPPPPPPSPTPPQEMEPFEIAPIQSVESILAEFRAAGAESEYCPEDDTHFSNQDMLVIGERPGRSTVSSSETPSLSSQSPMWPSSDHPCAQPLSASLSQASDSSSTTSSLSDAVSPLDLSDSSSCENSHDNEEKETEEVMNDLEEEAKIDLESEEAKIDLESEDAKIDHE